MRNFKVINIAIILLLVALLSFSGCTPKKTDLDMPEDQEEQQEVINIQDDKDKEKIVDDIDIVGNSDEDVVGDDTIEPRDTEEIENKSSAEIIPELSNDNTKENPSIEDEDSITLKIEGKENNLLGLTLDELKAMKDIIFQADYYWLNSFGSTGYTNFKGVNLWSLLEQIGSISADATKVTIIATDGYEMEFTIEQVKKQDYIDETNPDMKFPIIIAWEEDGQGYDIDQGSPFKLVVPQKEAGDVNKPQWVSKIDKILVK